MRTEKYSRQILFSPIGLEGQEKIMAGKVVIVGCGALGTAQAAMLARAGVGKLRIVDRDYVEESNLQRQLLFEESDAAERLPKAVAAERRLRLANSDVQVEGLVADLESRNAEELLRGFDVILDGTDNFETRYLLNDVSVKLGVPWIYGAVVGSYAATLTVIPGLTPCIACVFPEPPSGVQETCDTAGVIAPAAAWAASVQTTEALKILMGHEDDLHGSLLAYDIWNGTLQRIKPRRNPDCPACVNHRFDYLNASTPTAVSLCGRDAYQIHPAHTRSLDLQALKSQLDGLGTLRGNDYLVHFQLDGREITVFKDGRAIVKGVEDAAAARGLYACYVGA
ncbi:MAG TPA: ThiF family adenylyltransferase [Terriglobia bacterium]|nr:ThiF family adenylyltransferase [Terriglobia bacterium]